MWGVNASGLAQLVPLIDYTILMTSSESEISITQCHLQMWGVNASGLAQLVPLIDYTILMTSLCNQLRWNDTPNFYIIDSKCFSFEACYHY